MTKKRGCYLLDLLFISRLNLSKEKFVYFLQFCCIFISNLKSLIFYLLHKHNLLKEKALVFDLLPASQTQFAKR